MIPRHHHSARDGVPWRRRGWLCLLAGFVVLGLLSFGSSASPWWPRCPWRVLTGWACPGCGTIRSVHAALHGKWMLAFRLNPFLVYLLPVLGASVLFPERFPGRSAAWWLLVPTLAWWVVRNCLPPLAIPM